MTNAIQTLAAQPWVSRLGWTLLDFCWQGAVIGAVYAAMRRLATRRGPNARYGLASAALVAMVAAPLTTWVSLQPDRELPDPVYRIASTPPAVGAGSASSSFGAEETLARATFAEALPWVVLVWMAGAAAFGVRLAAGCMLARRMCETNARAAPSEWQRTLDDMRARVGVARPVRLIVSVMVDAPAVIGWWKPVVLAPLSALAGLAPDALEAVLAHELAHIRRHDYLVGVAQRIVEALLFYHPAVWWVSSHLRTERELCCDDIAVQCGADALTYARALAQLEAARRPALDLAMAATGGSLARRIARLLGRPVATETSAAPGLLTLAALFLAVGYGIYAQSESHPAFQAASIKRNTSEPGLMVVRPEPGGSLRAQNAPLVLMIQNAYQVQAFQIVGGPEWINSERYDVEAKPEGNTPREQMWKMLQTLLADRFHLALHHETRDVPGYALTLAKVGAKLPEPQSGSCFIPAADEPPRPPGPGPTPCGRLLIAMSPSGLQIRGGKIPMAELVRILAVVLGRPVLDRTDVTNEFDVNMTFTPDENTMGLPGGGGPRDPGGMRLPTDPEKPNILAAVQEQLGLKLSSAKAPVEVLVIDHVERPTAN